MTDSRRGTTAVLLLEGLVILVSAMDEHRRLLEHFDETMAMMDREIGE